MSRNCLNWIALIALLIAATATEKWTPIAGLSTRAAQPPERSLPVFEVDHSWPKVPARWKLGDASSIAIDAQDNIWVLHRPRTLKPEQAAIAAPPVIVFDAAGNYIKAWGGAGNGYEWPEREHGISTSTTKGSSGLEETIALRMDCQDSNRLPMTNF